MLYCVEEWSFSQALGKYLIMECLNHLSASCGLRGAILFRVPPSVDTALDLKTKTLEYRGCSETMRVGYVPVSFGILSGSYLLRSLTMGLCAQDPGIGVKG